MNKINDINQGDAITFKASDGCYKILLCTSTQKLTSPHYFIFAALTCNKLHKPSVQDVIDSEFYGVGNTKNEYTKYTDEELSAMWDIHPEVKPYYIGSYGLMIWRKDFLRFRDQFEFVANLPVIDKVDLNGNGRMNASDQHLLDELFAGRAMDFADKHGQQKFKVKAILKY